MPSSDGSTAMLKDRSMTIKDMNDKDDVLTFTLVQQDSEYGWDEYGILYNVTELMLEEDTAKKTNTLAVPQTAQPVSAAAASVDPSVSNEKALEDIGPKKKIMVTVQKQVLCEVKVVDFDGRMNRKDLSEFVDLIKPRKLVVVRSSIRMSERFAIECQNKPSCGVGLAPAPGECLDIAADSSVVRVRIPDETLQLSPPPVTVGSFVVQKLRGKMALLSTTSYNESVAPAMAAGASKRRKVLLAGGEMPSILAVREEEDIPGDSAECWYVSKKQEPNYPSIMDRLAKANIECRMKTMEEKSFLLCSENVVIWKPGDGRFLVGGPLCDTYFTVRRLIYGCFAVV